LCSLYEDVGCSLYESIAGSLLNLARANANQSSEDIYR
jgi:hypothetical protein